MNKAKSNPDPLAFQALLTDEEFQRAKGKHGEMALTRNVVLMSLTKSGRDLAQAAWGHEAAFMDVLHRAMELEEWMRMEQEIVRYALVRLARVGQELSDQGKPLYAEGDPEHAISA